MEIYTALGLADEIHKESERCYGSSGGVLAMEYLTSESPLATYLPSLNHRMKEVSPSRRVILPQHLLNRILRQRAKSMALITLRYNCNIEHIMQNASRVLVKTSIGRITAKYCVGCDGAGGKTRKYVTGNGISGQAITKSLTIVFRAALRRYSQDVYPNALVYVSNPAVQGLVRLDKSGEQGTLVVYKSIRKPITEYGENTRTDIALQIVYDAIGADDIRVELVTGEDWTAKSETSNHLQDRRLFLAGDAARQMAPIGGFAGNTGIQDVQNLAWRLLLVLRSQAPPRLMESYHIERHPIGVSVTEQASIRWSLMCSEKRPEGPPTEPDIPDVNVELGQRYIDSPGIIYETAEISDIFEDPFWPTASPGSRAPHLWFGRGNDAKSLYDHFRMARFVLLCSERGKAWINLRELYKTLPLKVATVPLGEFFSKYQIRDTGAVLVRPDGIIGWKAANDSEAKLLETVMKRLLGGSMEDESPYTVGSKTPDSGGMLAKAEIKDEKSEPSRNLLRRMTSLWIKK